MTIGENTYRFSVNKNKENIRELAAQVCNENAAGLGITTVADLESLCFEPVVASLSEQVDLTLEQVVEVSRYLCFSNVPVGLYAFNIVPSIVVDC